jgi:hypothetical protein
MNVINHKITLGLTTLMLFCFGNINAQGDGPRSFMLAPKGIWGVDVKWLDMKQNIIPSGNGFIPGADITVNAFPVSLFHTFSIKGKFAMVQAMVSPANFDGTIDLSKYGLGVQKTSSSGFSDGLVGFRMGLIGAPAINVVDFMKKKPAFSMMGMLRMWYSGTYDAKNLINLGTNRLTFEFGLPMNIPFGKNPKMPFWLETVPEIRFFTANTNPSLSPVRASKTRQTPLFISENHLTKNLHPKFWVGIDARFQYGGTTIVDGETDLDTRMKIFGIGISTGYQALPFLGLKASYGDVIYGYNGAKSRMLRMGATFAYVNMKKAKAEAANNSK